MPDNAGGDTRHHEPTGDLAMILYRLSLIDKKLDEQRAETDQYKKGIEERLRAVEDNQTRLSERQTLWNAAQAAFTATAAILAAIFHR